MSNPVRTIYLAGPIAGLTYDEARHGWREDFVGRLPDHIRCYSPMRGTEALKDIGVLSANPDSYPRDCISSESGIVTRDRNDVISCDAMVACFLEDGGRPSLGTAIEFGWAQAANRPIIMVAPEGNPHRDHVMMRRMAGYIVEDLDEAAHVVTHLLTPGV